MAEFEKLTSAMGKMFFQSKKILVMQKYELGTKYYLSTTFSIHTRVSFEAKIFCYTILNNFSIVSRIIFLL